MFEVIVALGVTIISATPPLRPAEAAAIMARLNTGSNITNYRGALPPWVLVAEQHPVPAPPKPASRVERVYERERPLQARPTIGVCYIDVPCIVGPPTVVVEQRK